MLLNDLFVIDDLQTGDNSVSAVLQLNAQHPIFKGHFPGRPVLPGACIVQLVQELTASITGKESRLIKAGQIKFITPIEPFPGTTIHMTLTGKPIPGGEWQVTAEGLSAGKGSGAGAACFRFKGIFRAGSDYAD